MHRHRHHQSLLPASRPTARTAPRLAALWLLLAGLLLALAGPAARAQDPIETAIIPLQALNYDEVKPMLETMLTDRGTLGYFKERRSIVVHDTRPTITKIQGFIKALDTPAANIRVQVEFLNDIFKKGTNLRVTADGGAPKVIIKDGKVQLPSEWEISGNRTTQTVQQDTTQFLMTRSGSPARLWAGERVRDASWMREYNLVTVGPDGKVIRATTARDAELTWHDVGSALYILPTYLDNGNVQIELYPVITARNKDGRDVSYKVQEVSTTVIARHGERVLIGGNDSATRKFMTQLLGPDIYNKQDGTDTLSIYLTPFVRLMDRAAPVDRASESNDTWRPNRPR